MEFYIAQGISVLTGIVAVLMMQFKSMKKILIGQILANLLTASTYLLLGGFSGAGINMIGILQSVVMFICDIKNISPKRWTIIGFIALYIGCSALYYKSPVDIFSALAAVCFALSVVQTKPAASRRWYSLNPLCWLAYDIFTRAYGNFIMHLVILISTVSAILRYDLPKKVTTKND
jgi:hypothetical protein